MLVARRDPPFRTDADDASPARPNIYPPPRASKLARFVTAIQMVGSLLAIPIGIASAYSFYRANFSPETTCQSLRSGIIALLDKSVNAAARRILVRRDVEEFEKTCAAVDPDATAAFKALLAAENAATPAAAPVVPKVQRSELAPKEPTRKAEPRPQVTAKQPAKGATPVVAEPVRRDAAVSDVQWLEAVRQALVTHKPELRPTEAAKPQAAVVPATRQVPQELASPAQTPAVAPRESVVQPLAPALPRPITVRPPPAPRIETDHPVPPESIPDPVPPANADRAEPDESDRSRIGKWISGIPLLGPVLDNDRH
ncbi:MAG TPA: hypothetical protein VKE53_12690 [Pseudolabrys sp.]|nr:hypothetical protein [Pseudolabrys sp.]